jgi:hypothetical protein
MLIKMYDFKAIGNLSDQDLLYDEHDTLVDITHDTSGDLTIHKYHDALLEEIKKRGLELLPRLNGTISF